MSRTSKVIWTLVFLTDIAIIGVWVAYERGMI
jgi:hypothetical protein